MSLNCANNSLARNLGVFFARIKGKHYRTGKLVEVRTMMHVIKGDAILLSRKSLRGLGVIEDEFPQIGKYLGTADIESIQSDSMDHSQETSYEDSSWRIDGIKEDSIGDKTQTKNPAIRQPEGECDPESEIPCSCPRRRFIDAPSTLPMPAVESNREALEEFIKSHYKAGAFNVCKRQPWPITSGPPMRIHTNPSAVPTYYRKPTKVPLHFRDEVRAGLEADVKKGIIRRVPDGTPDTWCSRMVIQPKKNGRARRTVDLSGLSKAGRRSVTF